MRLNNKGLVYYRAEEELRLLAVSSWETSWMTSRGASRGLMPLMYSSRSTSRFKVSADILPPCVLHPLSFNRVTSARCFRPGCCSTCLRPGSGSSTSSWSGSTRWTQGNRQGGTTQIALYIQSVCRTSVDFYGHPSTALIFFAVPLPSHPLFPL